MWFVANWASIPSCERWKGQNMMPALFLKIKACGQDWWNWKKKKKKNERERSHQNVQGKIESVEVFHKHSDGLHGTEIKLQNINTSGFILFKNKLFGFVSSVQVPGCDDDMSFPQSQHPGCLEADPTCSSCIHSHMQDLGLISQGITVEMEGPMLIKEYAAWNPSLPCAQITSTAVMRSIWTLPSDNTSLFIIVFFLAFEFISLSYFHSGSWPS